MLWNGWFGTKTYKVDDLLRSYGVESIQAESAEEVERAAQNGDIDEGQIFALLLLSVLLFLFGSLLLYAVISLNAQGKYFDEYDMYCPESCPNSLWTCTEGDIYFAAGKDGRSLGAAMNDGKLIYYGITFNWRTKNSTVWKLDNIAYPDVKVRSYCFDPDASYEKDRCILTYNAEQDKRPYFGEREGEVTLTFTRSNLPAPFSFDDEGSLNALPFR